jgi:hypothetical protein
MKEECSPATGDSSFIAVRKNLLGTYVAPEGSIKEQFLIENHRHPA